MTTGGIEGAHLSAMLDVEGIDIVRVPIAGSTRSNITVVEPDGTTTKLNERGAHLSPEELGAFLDAVTDTVHGADWVVASGSLPPGVPPALYAELTRMLAQTGVQVAIDTSGVALAAALRASPALVKPNREELAEATGMTLRTVADVVDAAQRLRQEGAGAVRASLGRDGAVLVHAHGTLVGETTRVTPLSSVGAGDAMLAGFLSVGSFGAQALAEALAWCAAAACLPGSQMPGPGHVDRRRVRGHDPPDLDRRLS